LEEKQREMEHTYIGHMEEELKESAMKYEPPYKKRMGMT